MNRPITGFRLDDHGDWTALLSCGHAQHVRHTPPFTNRPWVTTASGRDSRLGEPLPFVRCDRFELPERVVAYQHTPVFTERSIPASLPHEARNRCRRLGQNCRHRGHASLPRRCAGHRD